MKARSRLSRQAALSLEPLPGRPIPSDTLVFGYTVKPEDSDSDGISMDGGYQDSNGTWHNLINHEAITATGTETVVYRVYDGIGDQAGHKVDGSLVPVGTGTEITSNPDSGDTYRYGETIEFSITFSAPLEVEGSRHLSLRVGSDDSDGWRAATYLRGSGTNTLVFGYTVQTGDLDDDGVAMLGTWVENGKVHGLGGSGTVKVKGKGTDVPVTPTFTGLSDQAAHRLDGRPYPRTISHNLQTLFEERLIRARRDHPGQRQLRPERHRGRRRLCHPAHRLPLAPEKRPVRIGKRPPTRWRSSTRLLRGTVTRTGWTHSSLTDRTSGPRARILPTSPTRAA